MKKFAMQRFISLLVSSVLITLCFAATPTIAYAADNTGTFTQYIPAPTGATFWHFDRPNQLACDIYGNVYVADTYNNYVQKLNSNGELIGQWGTLGSSDGQFDYLTGIALDKNGNVYTADTINVYLPNPYDDPKTCRVQVFDANGNFIKKWTFNVDDGKSMFCGTIAVDQNNYVYVTGNGSVFKFDQDGSLVKKWTPPTGAMGIAADKSGNIYVTDGSAIIYKYNGDGNLHLKWGSKGTGKGKFQDVYGIAADNSGNIYVTDGSSGDVTGIVQKFTSDGKFIQSWARRGNPSMDNVFAVAPDNFGNVYVGEAVSVCKFTASGTLASRWSSVSNKSSMFCLPRDLAFDSSGNMYVVDFGNRRIEKFDKDGAFVTEWKTERSNEKWAYPYTIAISPDNKIYLTMTLYQRIDIYDTSGNFIRTAALKDCGSDTFDYTGGMDFGPDGNLYLSDYGKIQVYTKDMKYLRSLGACADVPYFESRWVAVGKDGNLYITNYDNTLIVYGTDGKFIRKWDIGDSAIIPDGVDTDQNGNVYVADVYSNQIIEFDSQGKLLAKWGSKGNGNNQFKNPEAIKLDADGNLFVDDASNNRIMVKPVSGSSVPQINYVSMRTSPTLGFTPGGRNSLPITVGVKAQAKAKLSAFVYNAKGKWVAQISVTVNKSGQFVFNWNGKATSGNTAGITAGKLVPCSSAGTAYKIKVRAQSSNGAVWSKVQTLKFYSNPQVKWLGLSSKTLSGGKSISFKFQVTRYSNVEARILNTKGKIAAVFTSNMLFPGKSDTFSWNGKATKGNTLGLATGAAVKPGVYSIQILAGTTVYKVKDKVTVK